MFIFTAGSKMKFHGEWTYPFFIWTNLDPKSSIFFLHFFLEFCFSFFGPLAGNVVLCQCHSIANVHALYFLVKADLLDLTRGDKKDPGQKGSRTRWIQDKSVFFSSLWPSPFSCPPCLCFSKTFFFGRAASRRGFFFGQNSILKKLNKFLFPC